MSINYQLLKVRTDKLSFGLTVSGESCRAVRSLGFIYCSFRHSSVFAVTLTRLG